jgi:molybdopterin-guanine dinucleotide biosynthesis protein A
MAEAKEAIPRCDLTAVVLAGGRARRMGGEDKGLVPLGGKPMVAYVVERLRPQVGRVLVNANRNLERYALAASCEVIADCVGGFAGPLAGMASAMRACVSPYLVTAPCDSPLVAPDLVSRLVAALAAAQAEICVAHDGERMQPVFALLRCTLLESVLAFLASGERKVDRWFARHRLALADLSDRPRMFLNINTEAEREQLEAEIEAGSTSATVGSATQARYTRRP